MCVFSQEQQVLTHLHQPTFSPRDPSEFDFSPADVIRIRAFNQLAQTVMVTIANIQMIFLARSFGRKQLWVICLLGWEDGGSSSPPPLPTDLGATLRLSLRPEIRCHAGKCGRWSSKRRETLTLSRTKCPVISPLFLPSSACWVH